MKLFCRVIFRLNLLALALALGACSFVDSNSPPPCPNVSILDGSERLVLFKDGPGRDIVDTVVEAEISSLRSSCRYDNLRVNVQTSFEIIAVRGPKSDTTRSLIMFFIAVVGPDGRIIGKEIFQSQIEFPLGRRQIGVHEEMVQRIPLLAQIRGPEYQVLVGFQLTPDQLEYNQSRRP